MYKLRSNFNDIVETYQLDPYEAIAALDSIINIYCIAHKLFIMNKQTSAYMIKQLVYLKYEHTPF